MQYDEIYIVSGSGGLNGIIGISMWKKYMNNVYNKLNNRILKSQNKKLDDIKDIFGILNNKKINFYGSSVGSIENMICINYIYSLMNDEYEEYEKKIHSLLYSKNKISTKKELDNNTEKLIKNFTNINWLNSSYLKFKIFFKILSSSNHLIDSDNFYENYIYNLFSNELCEWLNNENCFVNMSVATTSRTTKKTTLFINKKVNNNLFNNYNIFQNFHDTINNHDINNNKYVINDWRHIIRASSSITFIYKDIPLNMSSKQNEYLKNKDNENCYLKMCCCSSMKKEYIEDSKYIDYYTDGGLIESIPITKIINDEIINDGIIKETEKREEKCMYIFDCYNPFSKNKYNNDENNEEIENLIENITKTNDILMKEIFFKDIINVFDENKLEESRNSFESIRELKIKIENIIINDDINEKIIIIDDENKKKKTNVFYITIKNDKYELKIDKILDIGISNVYYIYFDSNIEILELLNNVGSKETIEKIGNLRNIGNNYGDLLYELMN